MRTRTRGPDVARAATPGTVPPTCPGALAGAPYEPYLVAPRTNGRESIAAAVATAAYRVLKSLFPEQRNRLRAQYQDYLAGIPGGWSKGTGIRVGARTAAAMIHARADDGAPGWEIKRQLASTQKLSVLETARLFAMADIVNMDAGGVACNNDRRFWSFWRPVTAIRLADTDGNPRTVADPDWTPLLVTPPIPEYPSGNTCGNGARMALYESFFGRDGISFSGFSADTGTRRHFSSFSQATAEVIEARIWGGIHFRTADVRGVEVGQAVTDYVVENHFRPLK